MSTFSLKLYIAGRTVRTEQAIANLRKICDTDLAGKYTLVVIDVLERPQLAENEKILATPTHEERPPEEDRFARFVLRIPRFSYRHRWLLVATSLVISAGGAVALGGAAW